MTKGPCILTINGGSSSIKFSLNSIVESLEQFIYGAIENIGTNRAKLHYTVALSQQKNSFDVEANHHEQAAHHLISWLECLQDFTSVVAIGHRVVHGMEHTEPELISDDLLYELKKISAFDPDHLPEEIKLIELFKKRYPNIKQMACFDTSFHASMPMNAKLLSIPRRYYDMGIRRYGFHGLSYAYLMEELKNLIGNEAAKSKIILAHLGSGASIAAVKNGKSMDTSMGFTPTSGLPMGTRTGDLDPGVAWYVMQHEKLTPKEFSHLINQESGLLGISETSADMRELMDHKATDSRAAEAIKFFCYQTKKWIGAFAAVLEGLDILVFSGGIGENSPQVRSKICDSLAFLGIELDEVNNMKNETLISTEKSKVKVYVIPTNEEVMIAKLVYDILDKDHQLK
ncbi:MAG: acetate/propionate family kinase [Gelidibacter sp.]